MSALHAIKKFRVHELNGLRAHIKRFGPIQTDPSSTPCPSDPAPSPITLPNPFLPRLNPKTGRWAPPKYSLRRQADLMKKARASGVVHLLPPGPKFRLPVVPSATAPEPRDAKMSGEENGWSRDVVWDGVVKTRPARVGLYSGKKRMFKGHKWERTMESREKRRKMLLRDMKKRILRYKTHHRRRRPNPLKPPRSVKAPSLPF